MARSTECLSTRFRRGNCHFHPHYNGLNKSSPELKARGRPWDHAAKWVETEVQGIGTHSSVCLRERQPFIQQPHKCIITSYDALKGSSLSTKETWWQHLGCFSWRNDVQGETWNITGQGKTPRDRKLMCKERLQAKRKLSSCIAEQGIWGEAGNPAGTRSPMPPRLWQE